MATNVSSDAEFVENVMASQSLINPVPTSGEGKDECHTRKRALSGNDDSEAPKKLKSDEGMSDLLDLMKAQFTSFRADFKDMRNEMTTTLESKFTSFESKLTGTVMKVVHEEIDSVKKDFNSRMDGLSNKLEAKMMKFVETHIDQKLSLSSEDVKTKLGISDLQTEVASLKKSYADAASSGANGSASVSPPTDGIELNVIIRNLNYDPREQTDKNITLNKVNKLLRDGLKLKAVNVSSCERKQSRGQKPGLIVARIETAEQKNKIMNVKNSLKNSSDYKDVYIEHDRSFSTRVNESNMFTVLKELGKAKDYYVTSNGRILKKNDKSGSRQ